MCGITGEELRICYTDASMDYKARQTVLLKDLVFGASVLDVCQ